MTEQRYREVSSSRSIVSTYLLLLMLHTLAASLIWGINTLFLLDAGLTNTEAFSANAFFTVGSVLFEVPTGVLADTRGRRTSYLLGTVVLSLSTILYLMMWYWSAPFWAWATASLLLGLGFTFFSGAFEAWLVDSLAYAGYFREGGTLEPILARGQIAEGAAMLCGSVAGGAIAQLSNLAVPYVLRAAVLVANFALAYFLMRDLGFTPAKDVSAGAAIRRIWRLSIEYGLANPPVRWVMLALPFTAGVSMFSFYAMQPFLLELWGNPHAYGVAGLAAAIVGGAQIAGGLLAPGIRRVFRRRTSAMITGAMLSALLLAMIGLFSHFWMAITLLVLWGLAYAAVLPVRQSYINGLIPSEQRATVLSFDSLLGSCGAVGIQPFLGKIADSRGYAFSYLCGALIQMLVIPFLCLARRAKATTDDLASTPVQSLDT